MKILLLLSLPRNFLFVWKLTVHHHTHKSLTDSTLCCDPVESSPHLFQMLIQRIDFQATCPSKLYAFIISHPFHPSWFSRPNNILRLQVMKISVLQFRHSYKAIKQYRTEPSCVRTRVCLVCEPSIVNPVS